MIPQKQLQLHNTPTVLREKSQWVCWRLEAPTAKRAKGAKIPYRTNGQKASVEDPTTWTSFDDACTAYSASLHGGNPLSGIGFVLTQDCGVVGVDIDHCIDVNTGELTEQAHRIVEELDTYCGISPSGTGLRLFVLGKKPEGGCRQGPLEIYGEGRYLTVTGNVLNGQVKPVVERNAELAAIHDREIVAPRAKAPKAVAVTKSSEPKNVVPLRSPRSGGSMPAPQDAQVLGVGGLIEALLRRPKARGLFAGNTNGYGSQSEADFALVSAIAHPHPPPLCRLTPFSAVVGFTGLSRKNFTAQPHMAS